MSTTEMSLALLRGQVTEMGARVEEVDLSKEEDEGGLGGPLGVLDLGPEGETALQELLVGLQGEREWATSGSILRPVRTASTLTCRNSGPIVVQ